MTSLMNRPPALLRGALFADALASGAVALLLVVAAGPLESLLAIPAPFLRWAGLILIPYVALVALLGTRDTIAPRNAWLVVEANVAWTVASVLVLVMGWITPNTLGLLFVLGQAAVVAGLGAAQFAGIRQGRGDGARPARLRDAVPVDGAGARAAVAHRRPADSAARRRSTCRGSRRQRRRRSSRSTRRRVSRSPTTGSSRSRSSTCRRRRATPTR